MPSISIVFKILKKGYVMDTNQSEWTLVDVLEHASRSILLNQELMFWLF